MMCVLGNFGSCLKEVKHLVMYDGDRELLWRQYRGIWLNLEVIWATASYDTFLHDISVPLYL